MAKKKKWASGVKTKPNALKRLGYPSLAKLKQAITSGRVPYKTVMSRLNFIANMGNTTAKRLRTALKAWHVRKGKDGG